MQDPRIERLSAKVVDVPDHPKPGILFKDLTPLFADGEAFADLVDLMATRVRAHGPCTAVVGMEARGFILGAAIALRLGVGFVPARKPGKLPRSVRRESYALEYGEDALEMHLDAIAPGQRVAIVDDVLATGGTADATVRLVRGAGAEITACVFLLELGFLDGRSRLAGAAVESLIRI